MVTESVKLNDGREVTCYVKNISTKDALIAVKNAIKITEVSTDPDTNQQKYKGDFSNFLMLMWEAMDKCISDFPDKENICPADLTRLYKQYAEPVIKQIAGDKISPN